jgi:hypothetical protein
MHKFVKIIFIFTSLLLLSSCVIFKGNNLEKVEPKQINTSLCKKKKIYVRWEFDFLPMAAHSNLTYDAREMLFERVLEESNCCDLVKKKSEADLIFEGKAYDQRNPARFIGFLASVATVYIIPSWHTAKIFVTIDVKDVKNTRHYEAIDSMTTAIWLPLIVATPFAYDFDKTQKEILENSYRSLLVQIKNDSFFSKK